jgi:hypothetical protein
MSIDLKQGLYKHGMSLPAHYFRSHQISERNESSVLTFGICTGSGEDL